MGREWDVSGDRGISDVVGVAILIALSIVGSLTIVAIGGVALNALTDQAQSDLADDSLRNVDARLSALADSPVDSTTELTFPEGVGNELDANGSACRVTVTAETADRFESETAQNVCSVEQELGTIVHERDNGNTFVYQGGGLWKATPAGTRVESEPNFDYDGTSVQFSFINLTSLGDISEGETLTAVKEASDSREASADIRNDLRPCWEVQGASGTVPVNISVTIHSEYHDGWGRYAQTGLSDPLPGSQVVWNNASNEVTLRFDNVGLPSDVFTSEDDFGGNTIYAGLSQYARFNANLTEDGSGFVVDDPNHEVGLFYQDETRWVVYDRSTDSWEYAQNRYSNPPDESTLPVSTSQNASNRVVYNFDDDQAICVVGGGSNVAGFIQGNNAHCKENMVGIDDPDAVAPTNTSQFDVTIDGVDDSGVAEGDEVDVDVNVTNTGNASATKYIGMWAVDADPNPDERMLVAYRQLTLGPGDSWTGELTWATSAGAAEATDVLVATEDGYDSQPVDVASAGADPDVFDVSGVTASPSPAEVGQRVTVDAAISHLNSSRATNWVWLTDTNGNVVNATEVTLSGGSTSRR